MNLQQFALNAARQTTDALNAGKITEAVTLSGEATATLDAEWTRLYNEGSRESDATLIAANYVAARHLDALLQADAVDEVFATAMMLLYRSTFAREKSTALSQSILDILCRLLSSALETGDRQGLTSAEAASEDVDHFAHILTYIASMLYAYYQEVGNARPDSPMLEDAYALLQDMEAIGAIQSPSIRIKDTDVSALDISAVMPDLLGRAKALGLLSI